MDLSLLNTMSIFERLKKTWASVPQELYIILMYFCVRIHLISMKDPIPSITDNEPAQLDICPPGTVKTTVIRKIRDTKLLWTKEECDKGARYVERRIVLPNGRYYAERTPLMPLEMHNGPDIKGNYIILSRVILRNSIIVQLHIIQIHASEHLVEMTSFMEMLGV